MIQPTRYSGIYTSYDSSSSSSSSRASTSGSHRFHSAADAALTDINSVSSGRKLLQSIAQKASGGEKKVTIQSVSGSRSAGTQAVLTRSQLNSYQPSSFRENVSIATALSEKSGWSKGKGSSAIIEWNSDRSSIQLNGNGSPMGFVDGGDSDRVSVLSHELVHAKHILSGTRKANYEPSRRYDPSSSAGKEEARAVGIGKYAYSKTGKPSENSIRQERGLPLRKYYGPPRS